MATVELCSDSSLGTGFQLHIGLAEIHVPRMWVEESTSGPNVRIIKNVYVMFTLSWLSMFHRPVC
jgi:hypothetical protein